MADFMINENNNTLEIEFFFYSNCFSSIFLPPLTLTIYVDDLLIIAKHHLFSKHSLFFLCTGLYTGQSLTKPLHITHMYLGLQ